MFKKTPVPLRALFETLEDGTSVNDFLQWAPGVTDEQVVALLEPADAVSERRCALRSIHQEVICDNPSVGVEAGLGESPEALDTGAPIAGAPGDHARAGIDCVEWAVAL